MGGGGSRVEVPKPVRMPTPTDPDIIAAGKRAALAASKRGGRQSTILSNMLNNATNGSQGHLGQ